MLTFNLASISEPIPGSAFSITGHVVANPMATFRTAAEMQAWLGERDARAKLLESVKSAREGNMHVWLNEWKIHYQGGYCCCVFWDSSSIERWQENCCPCCIIDIRGLRRSHILRCRYDGYMSENVCTPYTYVVVDRLINQIFCQCN